MPAFYLTSCWDQVAGISLDVLEIMQQSGVVPDQERCLTLISAMPGPPSDSKAHSVSSLELSDTKVCEP